MIYKHDNLWNDLPFDERMRLLPYAIEARILHIEQSRTKVVESHAALLRDFDQQICNLKIGLSKIENKAP